jgi:D-2-hydroxyacid dehydrogenase (NADP+)
VSNRVIFIGAVETDANLFSAKALTDFPDLDLFATNDRNLAVREAEGAAAMIGHHFQFDDELLTRAKHLRWIQSLTTGTDNILRLSALRAEVTVTSTRGMHGPQMSELVFLQMLALLRDFPRMQRNQAAHAWQRWPQPLLSGKTVVIVGIGAIAELLAPRCKAFGMNVYGVSGSPRKPAGFDGVFGRDELHRAAALADFLVLIVPYTPQTEKLVDASVIAAMKPGAFLVNVARGGVLDENALLAALREKRLAGAALDVFRETPLPPDHPLWREEKIIITPHIGGTSDIYLDQAYPIVRDNLRKFLAGETRAMTNIVPH